MTGGPSALSPLYGSLDYWQGIKDTLPESVQAGPHPLDQLDQEAGEEFQEFPLQPRSLVFLILMVTTLMDGLYVADPPVPGIAPFKTADIRRQLQGLTKDSERLMERLSAMPSMVRAVLNADPVDQEYASVTIDLDGLEELLAKLHQVADLHMAEGIARPHSGPPRDVFREIILSILVQTWEEYTGETAGYSYNNYGDYEFEDNRYQNPFLDFAEAVAKPVMGSEFKRRAFVEWMKNRKHRQQESD